MNVERHVGAARDLRRLANDLDAPAGEPTEFSMGLEPLDDVRIRERRLDRRLDIDAVGSIQIRVVMAFHAAHQIGRQVGKDARRLGLDNEFAKGGERHAGRPTLVDQRCDA